MPKHAILASQPDEFEADGPFEIRPKWDDATDDDDQWEVTRPTTTLGRLNGIGPAPIACCDDKASAQAVCDALNAFDNN